MTKTLCAVLLILCGWGVPALRSDEFVKGQIIPKVKCAKDETQTYVLFLPTAYDTQKTWPIIYAFDVGGHGGVPVKLLKDAAEKYGYLVVGSNHHCKGEWEPIHSAFEVLWEDTHQRLPINPDRVYMAGFDGGARVASRLGETIKKPAAGVLACGATFDSGSKIRPGLPFVYFTTVAEESIRLRQMQKVYRALKAIRVPCRLRIHTGKHGWPPQELATEAVEWFEIQAIQSGIKEEAWDLIDKLYELRLKKARDLEAGGQLYEAYTRYREIVLDFKGLLKTNAIAEHTVALRDTRTVTDELARQAEQRHSDDRIAEKADAVMLAIRKAIARKDPKKLDQLIKELHSQARGEGTEENRKIAEATFRKFVLLYDKGFELLTAGKYEEAIIRLALAREALPTHPALNYNLACAHALIGNKGLALKFLDSAVNVGYDDIDHIQKDKDLDSLRNEEGYLEIIQKLKTRAVDRESVDD